MSVPRVSQDSQTFASSGLRAFQSFGMEAGRVAGASPTHDMLTRNDPRGAGRDSAVTSGFCAEAKIESTARAIRTFMLPGVSAGGTWMKVDQTFLYPMSFTTCRISPQDGNGRRLDALNASIARMNSSVSSSTAVVNWDTRSGFSILSGVFRGRISGVLRQDLSERSAREVLSHFRVPLGIWGARPNVLERRAR